MRYQGLITLELVECQQISDGRLLDNHSSGENGQVGEKEGRFAEAAGERAGEYLSMIISSTGTAQRLRKVELGCYQVGQGSGKHHVLYEGEVQEWLLLRIALWGAPASGGQNVQLGEVTFRYDGNGFFGWKTGKDTWNAAAPGSQAGMYRFRMTGAGADYRVTLRAVVIDRAFER